MLTGKNWPASRTRTAALALVLLGSSFAILVVPPILHIWARVLGVSNESAMGAISVVYLLLATIVFLKLRRMRKH